jgi:fibro-slime domain-containing protein
VTTPPASGGGAGGGGTGGQAVFDAGVADAVYGSAVCGNGKIEGAESCDDGNTMPFDGCSEDCQIEPDCSGASCTSKCGDGMLFPPEQCDDGNTLDGDGCTKGCTVEPGFTCAQPPIGEKMMVPVIYRDFRFHNPTDFEGAAIGSYAPFQGMVNATLDANGKPVYSGIGGLAHVASGASFAEWYRDTTGVNHPTATKMALWNDGKGNYVNRYGANGEQWNITETAYYCGGVGSGLKDPNGVEIPCTSMYANGPDDCSLKKAAGETLLTCYQHTGSYSATFIVSKVDGNPLFFPVDNDPFSADQLEGATIFPPYSFSGTYPDDLDAFGDKVMHNFSFTTEVHYWFKYDSANPPKLDFIADDDLWVFINRKLAIDLGGIHVPVTGGIVIGADGNGTTTVSVTQTPSVATPPAPILSTATLGLQAGQVYEVAVFQAERQSPGSSLKLTLTGFNAAPSQCSPL